MRVENLSVPGCLLPGLEMSLELLAYEFLCWQRVSVVPAGLKKGRAGGHNPHSGLVFYGNWFIDL